MDRSPKGVGDTREDSPELMTDDMKSARSQRSMLDPLSNPFQYAKDKLRSLVTYDGYEVEYTPSVIPTAESEALPADARDPQGPAEKPSGSSRSPVKTNFAPVPPLQFSQGPMPTDRKQGSLLAVRHLMMMAMAMVMKTKVMASGLTSVKKHSPKC